MRDSELNPHPECFPAVIRQMLASGWAVRFAGTPLILLVLVLDPAIGHGAELTLAEVSQGILDAQAALKTVSVTCDYKIQNWTPQNGMLSPVEMHGVCTFDSTGRCRFEGHGERSHPVDRPPLPPWRTVGVFDGKRLKTKEGDNVRYMQGKVSERFDMPWPTDPREFLYNFEGGPIGKRIGEEGSHIIGTAVQDGRRVLEIESRVYVDKDGKDRRKCRYLVDCDHGFAVVRRNIAIFRPAANDWFDYSVMEGHKYTEVTPGIWLPGAVTRVMYGSSATVLQPQMLARIEISNKNWVVNAQLPDSQFQLEFEPDVFVTDEQTGKTYQAVKLKDDEILGQIAEGVEILQEKRALWTWNWWFWWGSLGVVAVMILAIAVIWRRRTR
jgi:hypothetical protein